MRKLLNILFLAGMMVSAPALAEDFKYQPEGCDFYVMLPSEPVDTRSCHPQVPEKCEMVQSFTKVYDLQSTINMYLSCRPAASIDRNDYNSDLMTTLLVAQPGVASLETYETTYTERDEYTVGGILGAGASPNGKNVMIYSASLWVSDHSILTVRGELIGANNQEADESFAQILRSIQHKDDDVADNAEETEASDSEENSENEETDKETESDSEE